MTDTRYIANLTQLGHLARLPASPAEAVLETVPNPHPGTLYAVRFTAPEFTALCPITGQPDFAHLVIDYVPRGLLVESKSLKLYLSSFRNHGAFHEDCTIAIASASTRRSILTGYASAAIGIRAAASPSTSSMPWATCRLASGCRTRAYRPIAAGGRMLPEKHAFGLEPQVGSGFPIRSTAKQRARVQALIPSKPDGR